VTRYSTLFVILGSALWATDALFRRPLTETLSPVTIVLIEHCILALVMLPVVIRSRHEFQKLQGPDYASLLFISLGGSVAATVLFTFAVKHGNPSIAILLQKTQPLVTVLLARLALGERPARWFWPAFLSAITGAYLMSAPDWNAGLPLNPSHPTIVLSALGAAALWGSATVCGRHLVSKISPYFLTGLRFVVALPALAVLFWLQPAVEQNLPATISAILPIVGMALIPGLLAMLLYYRGLRATTASVASLCELTFPVTAVVANWLILDVQLSGIQLLGAAILVAAVTVLAWLHTREFVSALPPGSKLIHS
jgi:drug/metabolite transporter (DMT)-like permease